MPVAFTKVKVKDLPYNFELNETMRMAMGAETLANTKIVVVGARISKTGNFMPQPGDLEGEMDQPVEVGDRGLIVTIRKVRQQHQSLLRRKNSGPLRPLFFLSHCCRQAVIKYS